MLISLIAGLALAAPHVNTATPYDPYDPDVIAFEANLQGADWLEMCDLAYGTAPMLRVLLGVDMEVYADEMYVAWTVENVETALGRNLSESGEARMVEALYDCIDYGVAL